LPPHSPAHVLLATTFRPPPFPLRHFAPISGVLFFLAAGCCLTRAAASLQRFAGRDAPMQTAIYRFPGRDAPNPGRLGPAAPLTPCVWAYVGLSLVFPLYRAARFSIVSGTTSGSPLFHCIGEPPASAIIFDIISIPLLPSGTGRNVLL
jgi:hypothetical protein